MNAFTRQLETQQHKPALALIETLLTELRRLDDKMILTEVHLLESRVYRGIGNLAKSKVRVSHPNFSLTFRRVHPIVLPDICSHCCQFDILPSTTPSFPRPAVWNSTRRGQRLYDSLLLLLRDVRELEFPGRSICPWSAQIHAPVQSNAQLGASSSLGLSHLPLLITLVSAVSAGGRQFPLINQARSQVCATS